MQYTLINNINRSFPFSTGWINQNAVNAYMKFAEPPQIRASLEHDSVLSCIKYAFDIKNEIEYTSSKYINDNCNISNVNISEFTLKHYDTKDAAFSLFKYPIDELKVKQSETIDHNYYDDIRKNIKNSYYATDDVDDDSQQNSIPFEFNLEKIIEIALHNDESVLSSACSRPTIIEFLNSQLTCLQSSIITFDSLNKLFVYISTILSNIKHLNIRVFHKQTTIYRYKEFATDKSILLYDNITLGSDEIKKFYFPIIICPTVKKINSNIDFSYLFKCIYNSDDLKGVDVDSSKNLVYSTASNTDFLPNFDIFSETGTNGVVKFFTHVSTETYDLKTQLNRLYEIYSIKPNTIISKYNVVMLFNHILNLWKTNLKTIYYTIYTCHSNCHGQYNMLLEEKTPQPMLQNKFITINVTTRFWGYDLNDNRIKEEKNSIYDLETIRDTKRIKQYTVQFSPDQQTVVVPIYKPEKITSQSEQVESAKIICYAKHYYNVDLTTKAATNCTITPLEGNAANMTYDISTGVPTEIEFIFAKTDYNINNDENVLTAPIIPTRFRDGGKIGLSTVVGLTNYVPILSSFYQVGCPTIIYDGINSLNAVSPELNGVASIPATIVKPDPRLWFDYVNAQLDEIITSLDETINSSTSTEEDKQDARANKAIAEKTKYEYDPDIFNIEYDKNYFIPNDNNKTITLNWRPNNKLHVKEGTPIQLKYKCLQAAKRNLNDENSISCILCNSKLHKYLATEKLMGENRYYIEDFMIDDTNFRIEPQVIVKNQSDIYDTATILDSSLFSVSYSNNAGAITEDEPAPAGTFSVTISPSEKGSVFFENFTTLTGSYRLKYDSDADMNSGLSVVYSAEKLKTPQSIYIPFEGSINVKDGQETLYQVDFSQDVIQIMATFTCIGGSGGGIMEFALDTGLVFGTKLISNESENESCLFEIDTAKAADAGGIYITIITYGDTRLRFNIEVAITCIIGNNDSVPVILLTNPTNDFSTVSSFSELSGNIPPQVTDGINNKYKDKVKNQYMDQVRVNQIANCSEMLKYYSTAYRSSLSSKIDYTQLSSLASGMSVSDRLMRLGRHLQNFYVDVIKPYKYTTSSWPPSSSESTLSNDNGVKIDAPISLFFNKYKGIGWNSVIQTGIKNFWRTKYDFGAGHVGPKSFAALVYPSDEALTNGFISPLVSENGAKKSAVKFRYSYSPKNKDSKNMETSSPVRLTNFVDKTLKTLIQYSDLLVKDSHTGHVTPMVYFVCIPHFDESALETFSGTKKTKIWDVATEAINTELSTKYMLNGNSPSISACYEIYNDEKEAYSPGDSSARPEFYEFNNTEIHLKHNLLKKTLYKLPRPCVRFTNLESTLITLPCTSQLRFERSNERDSFKSRYIYWEDKTGQTMSTSVKKSSDGGNYLFYDDMLKSTHIVNAKYSIDEEFSTDRLIGVTIKSGLGATLNPSNTYIGMNVFPKCFIINEFPLFLLDTATYPTGKITLEYLVVNSNHKKNITITPDKNTYTLSYTYRICEGIFIDLVNQELNLKKSVTIDDVVRLHNNNATLELINFTVEELDGVTYELSFTNVKVHNGSLQTTYQFECKRTALVNDSEDTLSVLKLLPAHWNPLKNGEDDFNSVMACITNTNSDYKIQGLTDDEKINLNEIQSLLTTTTTTNAPTNDVKFTKDDVTIYTKKTVNVRYKVRGDDDSTYQTLETISVYYGDPAQTYTVNTDNIRSKTGDNDPTCTYSHSQEVLVVHTTTTTDISYTKTKPATETEEATQTTYTFTISFQLEA